MDRNIYYRVVIVKQIMLHSVSITRQPNCSHHLRKHCSFLKYQNTGDEAEDTLGTQTSENIVFGVFMGYNCYRALVSDYIFKIKGFQTLYDHLV